MPEAVGVSASVTQVWPGVWVGSGMVPNPRDLMRELGVTLIVVASPTAYDRWKGIPEVHPILFDDTEEMTPHMAYRLLLRVTQLPKAEEVAFLCYAWENRSCFLAGLWLWWRGIMTANQAAGLMVQTRPNALNNRTLRGLLLALDKPLLREAA